MLGRAVELLDQFTAEIQNARIEIAQQRDGSLTEAEQIAVLDVYEEFGR